MPLCTCFETVVDGQREPPHGWPRVLRHCCSVEMSGGMPGVTADCFLALAFEVQRHWPFPAEF